MNSLDRKIIQYVASRAWYAGRESFQIIAVGAGRGVDTNLTGDVQDSPEIRRAEIAAKSMARDSAWAL